MNCYFPIGFLFPTSEAQNHENSAFFIQDYFLGSFEL